MCNFIVHFFFVTLTELLQLKSKTSTVDLMGEVSALKLICVGAERLKALLSLGFYCSWVSGSQRYVLSWRAGGFIGGDSIF